MVAVIPSTDVAVIAFLRDHAVLSPLHGGRVSTTLLARPCLRLTNLGGPFDWWDTTSPEFQFEAWADSQGAADALARATRAALADLHGPLGGGFASGTVITRDPFWSPDPETQGARYIGQFEITFHPLP